MSKSVSLASLLLAALLGLQGCGGDSLDNTTTTSADATADDSSSADTSDDSTDDSTDESSDDSSGDSSEDDGTDDDSDDGSAAVMSGCDEDSTSQIDTLICATEAFIDPLLDSEQASILYDWDNSNTERTIWSNLPTGNVQRNGMRIGQLSDTSYAALIDVAQSC